MLADNQIALLTKTRTATNKLHYLVKKCKIPPVLSELIPVLNSKLIFYLGEHSEP